MKVAKGKKKLTSFRSSCSHMFCKIGILKNFTIIRGNTCFGVSSCSFSKKRLQDKCFPVNIVKNFRATFFYRTPLVEFLFHYYLIHVYFKKYSITANNLIQVNINVPILDYISGCVMVINNGFN